MGISVGAFFAKAFLPANARLWYSEHARETVQINLALTIAGKSTEGSFHQVNEYSSCNPQQVAPGNCRLSLIYYPGMKPVRQNSSPSEPEILYGQIVGHGPRNGWC